MEKWENLTKEQRRMTAAIAARLFQEGMQMTPIAHRLGTTLRVVREKILPLARNRGYVLTTYNEERVRQDGIEPAEVALGAHNYANVFALRSNSLRITIVYSGKGASTDATVWASRTSAAWDKRLELFGKNAAPCLAMELRRADKVAVSWGKTELSVFSGLTNVSSRSPQKRNGKPRRLKFIPICGEPSRADGDEAGSSSLASLLNTVVNGGGPQPYSLKGVPALLHRSFTKEQRNVVLTALRLNPNYAQIFGVADQEDGRLAVHPDTILTSVGSAGQPAKMFGTNLLEIAGVTREEQERLIFGDIGGVLIRKSGADVIAFEDVQSLWTGIKLEDYRKVVTEASHNKKPGVIVFAIGGNKAEVVSRLVNGSDKDASHLISHLIIDHELAMVLDKQLQTRREHDNERKRSAAKGIRYRPPPRKR